MSLLTESNNPLLTEYGQDLLGENEVELAEGQIRLRGQCALVFAAQAGLQIDTIFTPLPLRGQCALVFAAQAGLQIDTIFTPLLLQGQCALVFAAQAGLQIDTIFTPLPLQGQCALVFAAQATLSSEQASIPTPIGGRVQIGLIARMSIPSAPRVWAQPEPTRFFVVVYIPPSFLKITVQLDNEPATEPEFRYENPSSLPAILSMPAPNLGEGGVSRALIVRAWQAVEGRTSPIYTYQTLIDNAVKTVLQPPKQATAVLLRQFSPDWRDLTRIDWDWGNQPPGQVEIKAYIRPLNGKGRQIKTLKLGIADSETKQFFIEGIGMKILTGRTAPEDVYFGLARYHRGESGPEIYTAAVGIKAKVQGAATTAQTPDQLAGRAVDLSHAGWVEATATATAQTTLLVSQVLRAALVGIKRILSQGGSVAIDNFGTFRANWSDPVYRKDPITSQITISPAQRRPAFNPSLGFQLGVQKGTVLSDVEAF